MNKLLSSVFVLFVTSVLVPAAMGQEITGDAKRGEGKISACIGCHGIKHYQTSFPQVYKVPMIAGQNAKYLMAALNEYQKGARKHPTMRGIGEWLNEQDMADVATYYEALGKQKPLPVPPKAEPTGKVAELITKGACTSCHGENFSKPIDPTYPKIAGQYADYLFVALESYKNDSHAMWGRSNAIMGGIAKQFSNAELKVLAKYLSSLPTELKTVPESEFKFK
ncbi:MAG: c-type cytochrome [Burkholderiaceae bacterium]